jgi:prephenate dehydrogenase
VARSAADRALAAAADRALAAAAVPSRIAFLGFGLIGGSIAMALRARARADAPAGEPFGSPRLAAWTPRRHGPTVGLARGILDAAPAEPEAAIRDAELVILAAPPLATVELLGRLAGRWRGALDSAAVVTDVASTKRAIISQADALGLRFVGGHPMAGRELTGIEAASAALFVGRPWVVTPGAAASEAEIARVEWLAAATGAAPVRLSAAEHDAAVAAVSHLPLLAAVALVEAVAGADGWPDSTAAMLAASGWRDATRLAGGSPEMGAGILATNATEILPRLRDLRAALDTWIADLGRSGGPDAERLRERLARARDRLGRDPAARRPTR